MIEALSQITYIVASALFILALHWMNAPETARKGVYAGVAAVLWLLLRRIFARAGLGRFVWHPALFHTALYVLILAGCIVAVFHWDR